MYLARSLSMFRALSNSLNVTNYRSSNSSTQSSSPSLLNELNPSSYGNYRMHITRDREKAEFALFEHVRKAVNSQETAPKQKHVRGKKRILLINNINYFIRMYRFCLG